MNDPRNDWAGREWSLRRLPSHVRLHVEPDWQDVARGIVWLAVRTMAVAALVVILTAVVAA